MRPVRTGILTALLLATTVSLWGCAANELGPIDDGVGKQDPGGDGGGGDDGLPGGGGGGTGAGGGGGGGGQSQPITPIYSGRYELTSTVDLAGANAFGDTISTTLVQISLFHDHPASTILNLMALYDVPYFSEVWDVLPGFIKDPFSNLLDDLIVQALFDEIPVVDQAAEFIADIGQASRNVELVTEMTLTGPTLGGNLLRGTHVMKGLGFHLWGLHASVGVPAVFQQITQLDVRAALMVQAASATGPQATMTFSKQNFAIPYGDMIMDAIKELVFVPAGTVDLASWLNHLINCHSIATDIGDLCVLGACVSDLIGIDTMTNFCTGGLDILGFVVESEVRGLKIELADLNNGQCEMYDKGYDDTRGDGKMDALSNGTWDMTIHINGAAKTVKAPFDGKRIADN